MASEEEIIQRMVQVIEEEYDLGGKIASHSTFSSGGYENINELLITENGNKYVARLSIQIGGRGTKEWLQDEYSLLQVLKQHIPVPNILQTKKGQHYFEVNTAKAASEQSVIRYGTLCNFCEGKHMLFLDGQRQLWQTLLIADAMSKFHSLSVNFHKVHQVSVHRTEEAMDANWMMKELRNRLPGYESISADLMNRTHKLLDLFSTFSHSFYGKLAAELPVGFAHNDMHDLNVLFLENEKKLSCILDWDDATIGPLIVDVALSMIEWCSDGPGKLNEEYIAAFLAQYEKNRQLTATEKAMLWKYAMFIGLWMIAFVMKPENKDDEESQQCVATYVPLLEYIANTKAAFLK